MSVKIKIFVLIAMLCLLPTLTYSSAYARLGPTDDNNVSAIATPEQLEECKTLGISPEKCSDIEILKHRCLDGPNSPCSMGRPPLPPKLAPFILSILTGYGIALVTGVYAVRKIRKVRKKATTE